MMSHRKAARKPKPTVKPDRADGSQPSPMRRELEAQRRAEGGPEPVVDAPSGPPRKPPHQRERELPPPEVTDTEFNPIRIDGVKEIPLYNPLEAPVTFQHSGLFWTIPPKGIALVTPEAAVYAVGLDNVGGRLLGMGVRRLYCNEPRFYPFAQKVGIPWYEWVEKRNRIVKQIADEIGRGNPYIEELQKLEIPTAPE